MALMVRVVEAVKVTVGGGVWEVRFFFLSFLGALGL